MLHHSSFLGFDATTYNPNTKVNERYSHYSKKNIKTASEPSKAPTPTHKRTLKFSVLTIDSMSLRCNQNSIHLLIFVDSWIGGSPIHNLYISVISC